MGIQRQFDRKAAFGRGDLAAKDRGTRPKTTLEKWNDGPFYERGKFMHATKGFRTLNVRRDRAQMIMAEQKQGKISAYTIFFLDKIARFINTGLW